MTKFLLIDHSLKSVGGHHYDYALHILQAAEAFGFEIHLATNKRFRAASMPSHWHIYPVFPHDVYSQNSLLLALPQPRIRDRLRASWKSLQRPQYLKGFAGGVGKVLESVRPTAGDHVFVPTASEFDLQALQPYLRANPAAAWHMQFHYNFFMGRTPDYAQQEDKLKLVRKTFADALAGTEAAKLHFYNTTPQIAAQYDRLGVAQFRPLPYPVNLNLCQDERPATVGPLRITCAGAIRAEKGQRQLGAVVEELWDDWFFPERVKLVLQSNRANFRLAIPNDGITDGGNSALEFLPHPLPLTDYQSMLRQADLGLLLYDSQAYYARCAGVLVEMLTAGVPVVVPAGCWLSEQLAEECHSFLEDLWRQTDAIHQDTCPSVTDGQQWTQHHAGQSNAALVRFRWQAPLEAGTYLSIQLDQHDQSGRFLGCHREVVGHRSNNACYAAFRIQPQAHTLRWRFDNAYRDENILLSNVEIAQIDHPRGPLSMIGKIAAGAEQVPSAISEIIQHHEHYLASASKFARHWSHKHDPARTIELLVERACGSAAA